MGRAGILGGGQLAMMLQEAASGLGVQVDTLAAGWGDIQTLKAWLATQTLVTFENEFVDTPLLKEASHPQLQFVPSLGAIELIQDKLFQKEFLRNAGLPTAPFRAVASMEDCHACARDWGWPIVLKTRRNGYDGKGTFVFREQDGLDGFWKNPSFGSGALPPPPRNHATLGAGKATPRAQTLLMAEAFVPFATELAIQVARNAAGEIAHFPVVETFQSNSICLWTKCPALIPRADQRAIESMATTVMEKLQAVGVFAVELFYTANGEIFINELAPRVHNSGHYTIEGCVTSQFAQHLRAVTGQPLGETTLRFPGVAMLNILGEFEGECTLRHAGLEPASKSGPRLGGRGDDYTLHWYHKTESRRGRKLGHITAWGETANAALATAIEARKEVQICPK